MLPSCTALSILLWRSGSTSLKSNSGSCSTAISFLSSSWVHLGKREDMVQAGLWQQNRTTRTPGWSRLPSGNRIFSIYHVYTWYIPCICSPPTYTWNIHGIYMDIPCISLELDVHGICMDIPCISTKYIHGDTMYIHEVYTWYIQGYTWNIIDVHMWYIRGVSMDIPWYS